MTCEARNEGGTMCCHRCGFEWDTNDPEPPTCRTEKELGQATINRLKMQVDLSPANGAGAEADARRRESEGLEQVLRLSVLRWHRLKENRDYEHRIYMSADFYRKLISGSQGLARMTVVPDRRYDGFKVFIVDDVNHPDFEIVNIGEKVCF